MKRRLSLTLWVSLAAVSSLRGETPTPPPPQENHVLTPAEQAAAYQRAQRAEKVRAQCIEARRYIAGRVMAISTNGLVVESGYSALLSPPFNQSWVVPGNVSVSPDPSAVEEKSPGALCIGTVNLANYPKRPPVKLYDYVVIQAYPAGEFVYRPVPGVEKTLRRYSASLETAVKLALARGE